MQNESGTGKTAEYKNGHRNPNSPRLMSFESGEEIERKAAKPKKTASKKKATGNSPKKKKKKSRKGGIDPTKN